MRVITGSARGCKLNTVPGDELVRPTSDRVKEAVFSIIQFDIEGRRVLDLFAGSGQLGIEALSRGAQNAVFVDSSKDAAAVIKNNLSVTKLTDNASVNITDALSYVRSAHGIFDIVFLDPPYNKGLLRKILNEIGKILADGGMIICELPFKEDIDDDYPSLKKHREYKYGKSKIVIYRKAEII